MLRLERGDVRLDDLGEPCGEFDALVGRLVFGVAMGVEGAD